MKYRNDLHGKRFGRLVASSYSHTSNNTAYWHCSCDCGGTRTVRGSSLSAGVVRSCGCYNNEKRRERVTIHGGSGTPAHKSWRHMRDRCCNASNAKYGYYGGRGISICPAWGDFEVFLADMGQPAEGETLDRIDPDGDYEPSNCRWASRAVQSRNQRPKANLSGYTGVYRTQSGKWAAQIRIGEGRRVCGPAREHIHEAVEDRRKLVEEYWR
jgi:hypothetical protein